MIKRVRAKYKSFIIVSSITTDAVKLACEIHKTNPPASAALGRALTGLILISSAFSDSKIKKIVMQFLTEGEISEITIETNMKNQFRAFIRNPNPSYKIVNNKLPVGEVVGKGLIYFYRFFENEVYQSISEVRSGEIAEDIAYFLYNSEQVPCAISLGVLVEKDGSIKNAGGLFVYSKPGVSEDEIFEMENKFKYLMPITKLMEANLDEYDLISTITRSWQFIDEVDIKYECWCNFESVKNAILSIPKEEVMNELNKNFSIEVVCRYCKRTYLFNKSQILELYSKFLKA